MDKRERWFSEGAPLFRQVMARIGLADRLPTDDLYYACPCCLYAFPFEAVTAQVLTVEHVPPEALGGKGMLLTCKRCNNDAGRDFDSHAQKRADFHNMMAGKGTKRPMRAVFEAGGVLVNGEAQSTGNGWFLQGVLKQNHPAMLDAHEDALRVASEDGETAGLKFTIKERFSSKHADVSWVRSAYLAAFSALGWSYILQPALNPIREQIKPGSSATLPSIIGFNPSHDADVRQIMIVKEPEDLSSVVVRIGHYTVFLPDPWGARNLEQLEESISSLRAEDGSVPFSMDVKIVPWPTKPMYALDTLTP
ncbi:HNH endonuclease [Streptomyces sp. NBC_00268]|uniref:HNH endonuclease n=1 Tax=Streptomyces sp. NBC_00268 TaxID=2975695 RepID=UPI0022506A15|nr:HNH endonuclease [Streptomyces sp. NBC_00268]MCX5182616.1 HNH endonuclease [Streptomyces sp. NBC_00268]